MFRACLLGSRFTEEGLALCLYGAECLFTQVVIFVWLINVGQSGLINVGNSVRNVRVLERDYLGAVCGLIV